MSLFKQTDFIVAKYDKSLSNSQLRQADADGGNGPFECSDRSMMCSPICVHFRISDSIGSRGTGEGKGRGRRELAWVTAACRTRCRDARRVSKSAPDACTEALSLPVALSDGPRADRWPLADPIARRSFAYHLQCECVRCDADAVILHSLPAHLHLHLRRTVLSANKQIGVDADWSSPPAVEHNVT